MKIHTEIRVGANVLHSTTIDGDHPDKLRRLILAWIYDLPVSDTGLDIVTKKTDDSIWARLTQVIEGVWVESAVFIPDGADVTFKRVR